MDCRTRILFLSITSVILTIGSLSGLLNTESFLDNDVHRREQLGGNGSTEERCGSITFEDIFSYNQANFDIRIDEDWETAQVEAVAWINWTLADDIREDLDGFLEGIVPSGGDGWLSSDEVGAVVIVAADCLQYSLTRIGIRDGMPHRGGVGVDWKNTSWHDEGMQIGEYNGVPPRHEQRRDCQGFGQDECYEIPVIPSTERNCDTGINDSIGADECRIMLWLNATLEMGGITDPNDFTIAFNASNISNARLDFTFPYVPDLRLNIWEECEGRNLDVTSNSSSVGHSTIIGSCVGDESSSFELMTNEDGSLTYSLFPSNERSKWPRGEDLFADFTTSPIPEDNPPVWTEAAPMNGSWIPVSKDGQTRLASWQQLSSWFSDESGISNIDILCSSNGGGVSQSFDRSLWVEVEGIVEVTCESIDLSGQKSGNRTWMVGVPFTISTSDSDLSDPHPISISPNHGWPEVFVEIGLIQGIEPRIIEEFVIDSVKEIQLQSANIVPGEVFVWIRAYHTEGILMEETYDLGIIKEGDPPLLTISKSEWNGGLWKISGRYSEPDGEAVTFSISIDGIDKGAVSIEGDTWQSTWLDLSHLSTGFSTVDIVGCDNSGKCTTISQDFMIDSSIFATEVGNDGGQEDIADDSLGLPAVGLNYLAIASIVALMYDRRRE